MLCEDSVYYCGEEEYLNRILCKCLYKDIRPSIMDGITHHK